MSQPPHSVTHSHTAHSSRNSIVNLSYSHSVSWRLTPGTAQWRMLIWVLCWGTWETTLLPQHWALEEAKCRNPEASSLSLPQLRSLSLHWPLHPCPECMVLNTSSRACVYLCSVVHLLLSGAKWRPLAFFFFSLSFSFFLLYWQCFLVVSFPVFPFFVLQIQHPPSS